MQFPSPQARWLDLALAAGREDMGDRERADLRLLVWTLAGWVCWWSPVGGSEPADSGTLPGQKPFAQSLALPGLGLLMPKLAHTGDFI